MTSKTNEKNDQPAVSEVAAATVDVFPHPVDFTGRVGKPFPKEANLPGSTFVTVQPELLPEGFQDIKKNGYFITASQMEEHKLKKGDIITFSPDFNVDGRVVGEIIKIVSRAIPQINPKQKKQKNRSNAAPEPVVQVPS